MAFFDKLQGKTPSAAGSEGSGKMMTGGESIDIRFGAKNLMYKDKATGLTLEVMAEGVCKAQSVSVPDTDVKGYANKLLTSAIEAEIKELSGVTVIENLPNKIPAFEKVLADKLNKSGFKNASVKLNKLDMTDSAKAKYSAAKK